jgi:hypothetical protein
MRSSATWIWGTNSSFALGLSKTTVKIVELASGRTFWKRTHLYRIQHNDLSALHLKTQSVPRSKHTASGLQKTAS